MCRKRTRNMGQAPNLLPGLLVTCCTDATHRQQDLQYLEVRLAQQHVVRVEVKDGPIFHFRLGELAFCFVFLFFSTLSCCFLLLPSLEKAVVSVQVVRVQGPLGRSGASGGRQ